VKHVPTQFGKRAWAVVKKGVPFEEDAANQTHIKRMTRNDYSKLNET